MDKRRVFFSNLTGFNGLGGARWVRGFSGWVLDGFFLEKKCLQPVVELWVTRARVSTDFVSDRDESRYEHKFDGSDLTSEFF
jgi:hypothetical protein